MSLGKIKLREAAVSPYRALGGLDVAEQGQPTSFRDVGWAIS
ncbi:MAG: hypothetical protein ACRDTC_09815 [Pseudonocardiaceae bacterium]